jgi:transposase
MADDLAPYWVLIDALTPAQGARLRADGIATRMMKPGGRKGTKGLEKAAERIRDALHAPSLAYPAEFEAAFADTVRTNLNALKGLVEHRLVTEARLADAVKAHPMYDLLTPARGAGIGAISGLIAEMGDDPHRFATADALMAFAGSAPAIDQSGGRSSVRRRDVKGNALHQCVRHWASSASNHEPGARHYYWTIRSRGSKHEHALRKVMNKLLRGVHVCVTTGTVWDDQRIWGTPLTPAQVDQFVTHTKDSLKAQKAKR